MAVRPDGTMNMMDMFFGKPKNASAATTPETVRKKKKLKGAAQKARRSSSLTSRKSKSGGADSKRSGTPEVRRSSVERAEARDAEAGKRAYLRSLNDKQDPLPPKPITAYTNIDPSAPPLTPAEMERRKNFVAWVMNGTEDFGKSKNLLDLEKYAIGWQASTRAAVKASSGNAKNQVAPVPPNKKASA